MNPEVREKSLCPVVGIGSSAGGVEALSQFFRAVPENSGNAYVVVQHLDPTRHSMLAELLGRLSSVKVAEVTDAPAIKPNRVYVISPNSTLTISDGRLHTESPVAERGRRMPIDAFFQSMANECRERSVGIILSGTGTDGTLGLKEIKAAGGIVMVQDPEEADHDGMPRSAIATGLVDYILSVGEMPRELMAYVQHPYVREKPLPKDPEAHEQGINRVLELLREHKEYDFRAYKTGTLTRRIYRRMSINHIQDIDDYVRLLAQNVSEVDELFHDLFIGVTSFFREPESWKALAEEVIPSIVSTCSKESRQIRVWVPGCSTGEEAYTVAMLINDEMRRVRSECALQVFGTDVDPAALERARSGTYPESIASEVPAEFLKKYFSIIDGDHRLRIAANLREQIVFAQQNILADPPFSKLDLICCRNLLIYLLPEYHRDVLSLCHFALRPGGYLFLGSAETVGRQHDLFQTISQKWRIYRRVGGHVHEFSIPIISMRRRRQHQLEARAHHPPVEGASRVVPVSRTFDGAPPPQRFADWARQILVSRYAPACVLIDRDGELLYYSGATHDYLVQPIGLSTKDIFSIAREGLGPKLHGAVLQARQSDGPVAVDDAKVRRGRDFVPVRFVVTPLLASEGSDGRLLIAFEDAKTGSAEPGTPATDEQSQAAMERLRTERDVARDELNATMQRLDHSKEDYRASNEELMSMNEELQSTNEELETSKEELQSLNEELVTANHQVQHKLDELEKANDDLSNLLSSTEIATIFLDMDFRIMQFTPAVRKLLNLLPPDMGRPITDFAQQVLGQDMIESARRVIQDRRVMEHEVLSGGEWYLRRILPYIREDLDIGGIVITFTNISRRKRDEDHLRMLIAELDHRVKNSLAMVATLAAQTLRRATSLDDFGKIFEQRIQALSRGHMLMTESRWEGTDLQTIVRTALAPHTADRPAALRFSGPKVVIAPKSAMALMMVIHELATNAVKYGALSSDKGRVELAWRIQEPSKAGNDSSALVIQWQELDGPHVESVGPPGFGTQFIKRAADYELGGTASIEYRPYGVHCELRLPLSDEIRPDAQQEPTS